MSVNSLNDIWQAVLGVLGQNLTDTAISTWFEDCEPVEIDGSTLVLKTSSDFKRDIIVKRFAETIKNAMSDIFSTEFTVKVLTEDELGDYEERKADDDPMPPLPSRTSPAARTIRCLSTATPASARRICCLQSASIYARIIHVRKLPT